MSAAPQFPPDYNEPSARRQDEPPRRPRRTWIRVAAWIGGGLLALLLLLVLAVLVALHSAKVHQYVLRVAQEKATAALGSKVAVREFGLHFSGISPILDLYAVVVSGAAPYPDPPLLQVDQVHVALTVTSLLHRTWYLDDIRVDHPVARITVDKHGTTNLPQGNQSSQGQSKTNLFDLGVRHALLDRGEVYYNNLKSALDADLHDLNFRSAFNPADRSYSGTLSYRNGHLKFSTYNPLPHDMDAQFTATEQEFTLQQAAVRSGASEFVLKATVRNYEQPDVTAEYRATVDAGEFRRILKNPTLPTGVLHASGTMHNVMLPNQPLLETMTLNGDLSSPALRLQMPSFHGVISQIGARYSIAKGNADVRDLRANLLGGHLAGDLTIRDMAGASRSHLKATLRGVSLAELKTLVSSPALQQVALSGAVNADTDATWGKSMTDLVARTNATINARLAPASNASNPVPLNGLIHARYAAATREIGLEDSYIRTPQTSLTLNGTVSDRSALQVRLQANDLHELESVAQEFRGPGATPLGLYGTASFNGAVRGSTAAPQITGQLTATNVRLHGSQWRLLRTGINANPSQVALSNGELVAAQRGRVTFDLATALRKWTFTESSPFRAKINAAQLNLADLARAAGTQTAMSGTVSADVVVHGTEINPIGQGKLSLTQAKIAGEPIQSVNANFNGTGDTVHANLSVRLPAGAANAVLTYLPRQRSYDAQVQAKGIRLDQLQTVKQRNLDIAGVLNLTASGRGTISNPELNASLTIPELDMRGQKVSGLSLQAAVANHVANFNLDSSLINTQVHGRGTVQLTGGYYTEATLDTQVIPLAPLVAAYAPSQAGNITGQTELHATLRGPLMNKTAVEAHVTIPSLAVNYKNTVQVGAAGPIHADYVNGVLQLQRAALRGTGTNLEFQGTVPVADKAAPVSLLVLGTIDLRLAQMLNPDISSSGQMRFNINSYGRRSDPNVQGQVQIVNANFATADVPIGLQEGNGVLTLTKDRLNITQFHGLMGGGDVTASGGVIYRPNLQFDLALAGRGIRMLYNNVRVGVSSNLALAGTTDNAVLRGQVRVNQLQFTPGFDLMDFMGALGGGGETVPPPTGGFSQNLRLEVGIASTTGIDLVSRTLSLQGAANLRLTGTAAQPVVLGRINLNGGDLIFNGNRYILQSGTLDFVNPSQTQPVVNVSVNTTVQQYNVQMHFWGPADHLHTNYSSDPALPPSDIINLVATGKTQEASAAQAANPQPASLGAEQLVASQVAGQVTNRVEKIAGISALSIDPVLGSSQGQNPGARITVQQRVTSKIFVTFATDVTSTQRGVIKLEYKATPRVSFSGTRDENGGFGFDTQIHKSW